VESSPTISVPEEPRRGVPRDVRESVAVVPDIVGGAGSVSVSVLCSVLAGAEVVRGALTNWTYPL
jgi:hypothetical protein